MSSLLTWYPPSVSGLNYRPYRNLSTAHAVILSRSAARHRSWCPRYHAWLWSGRLVRVPVHSFGSRPSSSRLFQIVPMSLITQGVR